MTDVITIATWNMRHSRRGWGYVAALGADIVLLQEAVPPPDDIRAAIFPPRTAVERWKSGSGRQWAAAIAVFNHEGVEIEASPLDSPDHTTELTISHAGTFVAVHVDVSGVPLDVVSLYGLLEGPLRNGQIYATTTLHRALSDLTPLIDQRGACVVGGDLNASTQIDPRWRPAHRNVFDRVAAFRFTNATAAFATTALRDCPCEDQPCRHVRTHAHNRSSKPWQDDYLFVKEVRLLGCVARDEPAAWELSDHCPVVAQISLEQRK